MLYFGRTDRLMALAKADKIQLLMPKYKAVSAFSYEEAIYYIRNQNTLVKNGTKRSNVFLMLQWLWLQKQYTFMEENKNNRWK